MRRPAAMVGLFIFTTNLSAAGLPNKVFSTRKGPQAFLVAQSSSVATEGPPDLSLSRMSTRVCWTAPGWALSASRGSR